MIDIETMVRILQANRYISGLEVSVFDKDKPIKRLFSPIDDFYFSDIFKSEIFSLAGDANLFVSDSLLVFGIVKENNSNRSVIFGPGKMGDFSNVSIRNIVIKKNLDFSLIAKITEYINRAPVIRVEKALTALDSLQATINHKKLEDNLSIMHEFYNSSDIEKMARETANQVQEDSFMVSTADQALNFEKQILDGIKNGYMPVPVSKEGTPIDYKDRGTSYSFLDPIRQYKDRCVSMITLISRAAMEGGLDYGTSYSLMDVYIEKIEVASSTAEMNRIQTAMMMDYVGLVKSLHYKETENPTINRVIHCINEHIREKLTAEKIAEYISISPSYISSCFKKFAGMNLPAYISKQKIEEAKRLLRFTDKPLSDIATYLSFSSQSYFQNIFKSETGMTPLDYRKEKKVY
jgi:AraC-like DNA-binding protein